MAKRKATKLFGVADTERNPQAYAVRVFPRGDHFVAEELDGASRGMAMTTREAVQDLRAELARRLELLDDLLATEELS